MSKVFTLTPHQLRAQALYALLSDTGVDHNVLTSVVGCQMIAEGIKVQGLARTVRHAGRAQFYVEVLLIDGLMFNEAITAATWEDVLEHLVAERGDVEWGEMHTPFNPEDHTWLGSKQKAVLDAGRALLNSLLERQTIASETDQSCIEHFALRPVKRL